MKTTELKTVRVAIDKLKPDPANARVHGQANIESIRRSLKEFGQVLPIVVNRRTGLVVGGHGTIEAMRLLGWKQASVAHVSLTALQAKALALVLNRSAELAEWDNAKLLETLVQIQQGDNELLAVTGFTPEALSDLQDDAAALEAEGDPIPPPPKNPVTKPGDLWVLGEHRLLCGDSTKAQDVQRVMNGKRAVLFATDPPYLVAYDGTNHPGKNKQKRNKDWGDLYAEVDAGHLGREFYVAFIKTAMEHAVTPNAAWYCWHAFKRQALLEGVWDELGVLVHQQVIWVKSRGVLTRSVMLWQHEPCFFGWRKGKKPAVRKVLPAPTTVWSVASSEIESDEHPTSKPVALFTTPIELHTKRGDVCFEPFSGSGSQLVAAEKSGRRCYAIEIVPAFCDVAVKRWENLTGRKATRVRK